MVKVVLQSLLAKRCQQTRPECKVKYVMNGLVPTDLVLKLKNHKSPKPPFILGLVPKAEG